jgi:hypothetical protein
MSFYTFDRKTVADMLKISLRTLDRYVAKNIFSIEKRGGKVFFNSREIDRACHDRATESVDTGFTTQSSRLSRIQSLHSTDNVDVSTVESVANDVSTGVSKVQESHIIELQKKLDINEVEARMYKDMYEKTHKVFLSQQEQLQKNYYQIGQLEQQIKLLPSQYNVKEQTHITQLEKKNIGLHYDIKKNQYIQKLYFFLSMATVFLASLLFLF